MKPKLITTGDGSHSLYVNDLDEHYHSRNGALTESMHVFINTGLHAIKRDNIHILEIGFGTGLNAFLSLMETRGSGKKVYYRGLEKFPLDKTLCDSLNYAAFYPGEGEGNCLRQMHDAPWNQPVEIEKDFILEKTETDIINMDIPGEYDLVYFDAFGPDKQPELWTPEIFARIFKSMKPGAVLTTYSSKGEVRRNLEGSGFRVEKLPGPPGKREMTRAWKD